MLDQMRRPSCKHARKSLHHPDRSIRRSQQNCRGITADRAAVERRDHLASFTGCKSE
jgi:hypothetical protein